MVAFKFKRGIFRRNVRKFSQKMCRHEDRRFQFRNSKNKEKTYVIFHENSRDWETETTRYKVLLCIN